MLPSHSRPKAAFTDPTPSLSSFQPFLATLAVMATFAEVGPLVGGPAAALGHHPPHTGAAVLTALFLNGMCRHPLATRRRVSTGLQQQHGGWAPLAGSRGIGAQHLAAGNGYAAEVLQVVTGPAQRRSAVARHSGVPQPLRLAAPSSATSSWLAAGGSQRSDGRHAAGTYQATEVAAAAARRAGDSVFLCSSHLPAVAAGPSCPALPTRLLRRRQDLQDQVCVSMLLG